METSFTALLPGLVIKSRLNKRTARGLALSAKKFGLGRAWMRSGSHCGIWSYRNQMNSQARLDKSSPGPNNTQLAVLSLPPEVIQSTFDSRTPSLTGVGLRSPYPLRPITRRMGAGWGLLGRSVEGEKSRAWFAMLQWTVGWVAGRR